VSVVVDGMIVVVAVAVGVMGEQFAAETGVLVVGVSEVEMTGVVVVEVEVVEVGVVVGAVRELSS